jgi:hypothetical protein
MIDALEYFHQDSDLAPQAVDQGDELDMALYVMKQFPCRPTPEPRCV